MARAAAARADDASWPRLSSGPLQDNSFLIEEAYNQERGVVQHIVNAVWDRRTHDWTVLFTQEWPVLDETHQLSYTVPYTWPGGRDPDGPGDVLLNYRYQLLRETAARPAIAPRLSLVLPTGSVRDGLGNGTVGVQVLVPVSKQIGPHWAAHLDLGTTVLPAARTAGVPGSERLVSWTGGGSVIWEPWDAVNVLAELLGTRDEDVVGPGDVETENRLVFSPGVRLGWNLPAGVQLVTGAAVPVGLTSATNSLGVFLYFSLEHAFTREARAERW